MRINSKEQHFNFEEQQVNMVSFGPSCGLAVHKLAIAVGPRIHVYQLMSTSAANTSDNGANLTGPSSSSASLAASATILAENGRVQTQPEQADFVVKTREVLEEGSSQVVRFSWNVLGDVISAVYADGLVRIWRCEEFFHRIND